MKICKDGRIWGQTNKGAGSHLGIVTGSKKRIKKGYNPNSAIKPKGFAVGKKNSMYGVHRVGKDAPFYGKHHTKETRLKIIEMNKGKPSPMEGKHHSKKTKDKIRKKMSGNKNWNWKGGISESYQNHRSERGWKELAKKVYKRDNYQCQLCGAMNMKGKTVKLQAHHIIPWRVEHNDKMNNFITLCNNCHPKVEKKWWQYAPMFFEMLGVYIPLEKDDLFKHKRR